MDNVIKQELLTKRSKTAIAPCVLRVCLFVLSWKIAAVELKLRANFASAVRTVTDALALIFGQNAAAALDFAETGLLTSQH